MPNKKDKQTLIKQYINTFSSLEKKAFNIAKKNLESSFDIEKSIGFCDWVKEKEI